METMNVEHVSSYVPVHGTNFKSDGAPKLMLPSLSKTGLHATDGNVDKFRDVLKDHCAFTSLTRTGAYIKKESKF